VEARARSDVNDAGCGRTATLWVRGLDDGGIIDLAFGGNLAGGGFEMA
jgi:hypothetical protein